MKSMGKIGDIMTSRTQLLLSSGVRSFTQVEWRKISQIMDHLIPVLEDFFWGQGPGTLSLQSLSVEQVALELHICGRARIKQLNSSYRGKNKVTDVLSFPVYENLRKGRREKGPYPKLLLLGDIVICREVLLRQAREFQLPWEQELIHLFIHGLLHLCGYDHEISRPEERVMFKLEDDLVRKAYERIYKRGGKKSGIRRN